MRVDFEATFNALTAVSVYIRPDHFSYTNKSLKNQSFIQKSQKNKPNCKELKKFH